jgi:hypothetical protein
MRDNSILVIGLVIIFCVIVFGGHLGLSITGNIQTTQISQDKPGLLSLFDWIWGGVGFFFAMLAFRVPGMPNEITIFFIILLLAITFILLKFVRGTNT